jgi:molecular chaperone DnaK
VPQIEVTFDIDANGILNVAAKEKATGKQQSITITGSTNLDKGEIDRMVHEAQSHAQEDSARREQAEAKNRAEAMIYSTEQLLKDVGGKAPGDVVNQVQSQLTNLREALDSGDAERIKSRMDSLQEATFRLSEAAYQAAGAAEGAGADGHGGAAGEGAAGAHNPEEEVIEAEYKTE